MVGVGVWGPGMSAEWVDQATADEFDRLMAESNGPRTHVGRDGKARTTGEKLALIPISVVNEETVRWLSYPRIPQGKVVIIGGDPGVGKGLLMSRLVAALTTGKPLFPDQLGTAPDPGDAVVIEYEDGIGDTVKPRMRAAGADQSRVYIPPVGDRAFKASDVPALDELLEALPDVRMIFISPVGSFIGGKTDTYRDNEVRDVLNPLAALAERRQITVILIMHLNKQSLDTLLYKLSGSIAFAGVSRSVLVLGRERDGTRLGIVHEKNNLGPEAELLEYRISAPASPDGVTFPPAALHWVHDTELTEDILFGGSRPGPKPVLRDACSEWLNAELGAGPRPVAELFDTGKQLGFSEKVVYAAAKEVGIRKYQQDRAWWWELKAIGAGR